MTTNFYSQQSEEKLLGLLLHDNKLMTKVAGLLNSDDFFLSDHQVLFVAFQNSFENHSSADTPFLIEELSLLSPKSKEEWVNIFSNLLVQKGIESNIDKYVELIKEKRQARDLQRTLTDSVDLVNKGGDTVTNLIGQVETRIQDITRQKELKDFENMDKLTNEFLVKMKKIQEDGADTGIKMGMAPLDTMLGGLQDGQFVIVAARPSVGKTAFSLEIARNVAKTGRKVGFFSLEMPSTQIIMRMIASEAMINNRHIYNNKHRLNQLEQTRLEQAEENIKNMTMRIDDSATIKTGELAWKARKAFETEGLDLIIIDYLQLIDSESKNNESRQQAVSEISRQLKALARELEIPVIALSQLSRRVENRESKRPIMSDIRESGAIEQDADIILFLHREDYQKEAEEASSATHQDLEVIIAKNRNGATGSVRLGIDLEKGRISTLQRHNPQKT